MPTTDVIAFLSLIVALSAYVATIRLRIIDKMKSAGDVDKERLRCLARLLTLADAPLIIAAAMLFVFGFWTVLLGRWFTMPAPIFLQDWSIYLSGFAGMILIGHHIAAWKKSIFG